MARSDYTGIYTEVLYGEETSYGVELADSTQNFPPTNVLDKVTNINVKADNQPMSIYELGGGVYPTSVVLGTVNCSGSVESYLSDPSFSRYLLGGDLIDQAGDSEANFDGIKVSADKGKIGSIIPKTLNLKESILKGFPGNTKTGRQISGVAFTNVKYNFAVNSPVTWSANFVARKFKDVDPVETGYSRPASRPYAYQDITIMFGTDRAIGVVSGSINFEVKLASIFELGSRFLTVPIFRTRSIKWDLTVLLTNDDAADIFDAKDFANLFYGATGVFTTGGRPAMKEMKIELTRPNVTDPSKTDHLVFQFEKTFISTLDQGIQFDDDKIQYSVTGESLSPKIETVSSEKFYVPIKWWRR